MSVSKQKLNTIEISFRRAVFENKFSKLVVTVSGGADSIALLSALSATEAVLIAAHCNFHLRGDESMRDQKHVEKVCKELNVALMVKDFDVAAHMAANRGMSAEMACRELRYEWFAAIASETGADRIVTGHNADDNIETLFLNLLRGSGTSGLRGMLPDTGKIWRPLLSFHRHEIEKYLEDKKIPFITDSSNLTNDYRRNFIRNEIVPLLKSRWAGFEKALDRSVALLRSENEVVTAMVNASLPDPGKPLEASAIMNFPDPELLVRRFIEPIGPFTTTAGEVISAIKAAKPDRRIWRLRKGDLILKNGWLSLHTFIHKQ
ncbi:MAG: tRNA lysidine(34) synthetase TilS [Muribaculaceae bacterium]|nr:tRNA lysidine(34) synthetase TilS [Muribaculaceae bacterium]